MNHDDSERVRIIVSEALLREPADRRAYLDEVCAHDESLREEVETLIGFDSGADSFLQKPAVEEHAADLLSGRTPGALPRIDGFDVRRLIAAGGMGAVYEAQQHQPRRTVALKLMRPGFLSRTALRRFEHEAQVLARLRHPGIAQVYEAGMHDDGAGGVPYFAMEYVPDAQSVVEFADSRSLSVPQRLELFIDICEAIEHGHLRGVIHRDLKPANILVDAGGQPKVIDFGVARATDADITLTTMQTDVGQLVGTLTYMSPEQCAADPAEIDTRSDVYALGVVLYELLCGRLPYDVRDRTITEAVRVIQDDPPTRPGTVHSELRGDLETILLKSLEKDRDRRYQSAGDFARDVQRFLDHEPIAAKPPSMTYQLRLFARRNRTLVTATGAIALALVATAIISTSSAVSARRAARAEADQREAAEQITGFLGQLLTRADPTFAKGEELTVREVLDQSSATIEEELGDRPVAEAAIRALMGKTYRNLGVFDEAERHTREALAIRRRLFGDVHEDTLDTMNDLALLMQDLGRFDEAAELYHQALNISRTLLGEEDPRTLMQANNIGWLYIGLRRLTEAEPILARTLEIRRRVSGDEDLETLRTMVNLAGVLRDLRRVDEADPLYDEAMSYMSAMLEIDPGFATFAMTSAAAYYEYRGMLEKGESIARDALTVREETYGTDHAFVFYTTSALANILSRLDRHGEAETMYLRTFEGRYQALGAEHADTMRGWASVASFYYRLGWSERGEAFSREWFDQFTTTLGVEHALTRAALSYRGNFLLQLGRHGEAEAIYKQQLDVVTRVHGADHAQSLIARYNLGNAWRAMGRAEEAEEIHRQVYEARVRLFGESDERTIRALHTIGLDLHQQNRFEEAERIQREALRLADEHLSFDNKYRQVSMRRMLGQTLVWLDQFDEAETLLTDSIHHSRRLTGQVTEDVRWGLRSLIELYERWEKPEQLAERETEFDSIFGADD